MRKNSLSGSTLLIIAGAGAIAWYFFRGANTLNNLIFVPRGMSVVGGGVSVRLGVQNPTSNPVNFNSLAGQLVINGSAVGNISSFSPQVIAPNSESIINLTVFPNAFGLASQALDLLDGNGFNTGLNPTLTGTANVNNIPIPVNIQIT